MYGMYRGAPTPYNRQVNREEKEIIVKAFAQSTQKADYAIIAFEILSFGDDPVRAITNNTKSVELLNQSLEQNGIRDEDIFYSSKSIEEVVIDGNPKYVASTIYQVNQYDLEGLSELLYNLRAMDAKIDQIIFTSSNNNEAWNKTFQQATANAYARAKAAAEQLKVTIDPVPIEIKDITNVEEVYSEIQQDVIKDYASIATGLVTNYSIVEARYRVIENL